ncbi:hypothetical protein KP509_36G004000 [Ceratopteris richardii]|uniref:DNA-directed DNA polymerase n=1 Tax=Ceratopteris richardii TaxID=49495 RepID=A0A8T2QAB9_CERRI|nr:hypothetical protein KP509_36G004000 [Ceratopteris richardii]
MSFIQEESTTQRKAGIRRKMLFEDNAEVPSPLILSPHEDIDHSESPFMLEEPASRDEDKCSLVTLNADTKILPTILNVNLCGSYQGINASKSNNRWKGAEKYWQSQSQLLSSSNTSKSTSQASVLGIREFSSSDGSEVTDSLRNICDPCSYLSTKQEDSEIIKGNIEKSFKLQKEPISDGQNVTGVAVLNGLQPYLHKEFTSQLTKDKVSLVGEGTRPSTLSCEATVFSGLIDESFSTTQHYSSNEMHLEVSDQPSHNLSKKHRPLLFDEVVGQELVIQALCTAILKGKIAPVYLFHGPPGTGKTSTARILAAALNCCGTYAERRPCTFCSQCKAFGHGKSSGIFEVDAASDNGAIGIHAFVQNIVAMSLDSRYRVLIIDQCHLLGGETWNALLNFLEEPPGDFVSILTTTDMGSMPCTALSRCQKFCFTRVKHSDILRRLTRLVVLEGLHVEDGALDMIASQSGGSLHDAEMILDHLSHAQRTITSSSVLELVAPMSDERLLCLLDLIMGSDTMILVKKVKELVDSGIRPLDLITRLARLIMDILTSSRKAASQNKGQPRFMHINTACGLEKLSTALRIILEAEKQLKTGYGDQLTCLIAALLRVGHSEEPVFFVSCNTSASTSPTTEKASENVKLHACKGRRVTKWKNTTNDLSNMTLRSDHANRGSVLRPKARLGKTNHEARVHPTFNSFLVDLNCRASLNDCEPSLPRVSTNVRDSCSSIFGPSNLANMWLNILKGCKSIQLQHLLSHGKLLAVCFSTVETSVHLEFKDPEQKSRAERYRKVIATTCKRALGFSVNVKISLASQSLESAGDCNIEDELSEELQMNKMASLTCNKVQSGEAGIEQGYLFCNGPAHQKSGLSRLEEHYHYRKCVQSVETDAAPKVKTTDSCFIEKSTSISYILRDKGEKSSAASEPGQATLKPKTQPTYGRLLCWRVARGEKRWKRWRKRKCRALNVLNTCARITC